MSSECGICYTKEAKYTVQCGSTPVHQLCFDCEREWRLKSKPTQHGRILTCPFCRGEETEPGLRSRSSYEAELQVLYQELYRRRVLPGWIERSVRSRPEPEPVRPVRPPSPPYVPRIVSRWCKNRSIACTTQSTTARKCSYPGGCTEHVCRQCKMCVNHFQPPVVHTVQDYRIEIWD